MCAAATTLPAGLEEDVARRRSGGSLICAFAAWSTKPPTITTKTIRRALDDLAEIGVDIQEDQVGRDQGQDEGGEHRPDHAAAPASRLTPPITTAANPLSV